MFFEIDQAGEKRTAVLALTVLEQLVDEAAPRSAMHHAELLSISQQQIASYEVGRRRVPVSSLSSIARALAVSIEELVGDEARPGKRGPTPKLQQQLERITQLPKTQQKFVMQMIDTVLAQASR